MKRLTLVLVTIALLASSFWLGRITTEYSLFRKVGMTRQEFMRAIPELVKMAQGFNPIDEDARTMFVMNDLVILSLLERNQPDDCRQRIATDLAAYYHANRSRPKPTSDLEIDYPHIISQIEKVAETSEALKKAIAGPPAPYHGGTFWLSHSSDGWNQSLPPASKK